MGESKTIVFAALLLAVGGSTTLQGCSSLPDEETPLGAPASVVTAPQPVSPADQTTFVDSSIVLKWDWPSGLATDQVFSVRVWYEDEAPLETWTQQNWLDAQLFIDSFSRELGAFHWQVAVINTSSSEGFVSMGSDWSPLQTLNRVRRLIPTAYPESQQSETARFVASQHLTTPTEIVDYVRHFINVNSARDYQEPGLPNRSLALARMLAYSQGQGDIPHLLCDGEATAMLTLLQELGIESRFIALYGDGGNIIVEHTVLEVFNPDTQRWEVQDPYQDVYYLDINTQKRASMEHMVFGSLDSTKACDDQGCGKKQIMDMVVYFAAFRYGQSDTFWVNPDRFDVSKRFLENKNANLAEYLTGNPRDFLFRFDSGSH
jgi:hypothetical protein